jgi:hypothetical protein
MTVPLHVSQYVTKMNHPLPGRRGIAGGEWCSNPGQPSPSGSKICVLNQQVLFSALNKFSITEPNKRK